PRRWRRRFPRRSRCPSNAAPSLPAPRKSMCAAASIGHTPTGSGGGCTRGWQREASCQLEERAVPKLRSTPLMALVLVAGLNGFALGQDGSGMGPPVGGPSGNFLGPPQDNAGDFLGDWK